MEDTVEKQDKSGKLSMEEKHLKVLERFKIREAERRMKGMGEGGGGGGGGGGGDLASRKKKEQADGFEADLQSTKKAIEAAFEDQGLSLEGRLQKAEVELQQLRKTVSAAQSVLTPRNKRLANELLASFEARLQNTRFGSSDPSMDSKQQQFSFKKKAFKDPKPKAVGSVHGASAVTDGKAGVPVSSSVLGVGSSDGVLSHRKGEVLSLGRGQVEGTAVALHGLENCTVSIQGSPSTLHATHLVDCTVFVGPVSTSVFVEGCRGTRMALACQQLRVHTSKDCAFRIHVVSRSVIEECSGLRFEPYDWTYEGIDEDYERAGLDRAVNNWRAVDDFDWLASDAPSPNFTLGGAEWGGRGWNSKWEELRNVKN